MPDRPRPVLVVKTGTTNPEVIDQHGDYDAWFAAHLRALGVDSVVCPAFAGAALPDPEAYDGVILTGSPLSVRDEAPWMQTLAAWTLAAAAHTPVLAVCFGHQLVGEALGGRVEPNPAGGEYGTIDVSLTAAGTADPLFAGFGGGLSVQSTHKDALVQPPAGATLLGSTDNTPWQAFGYGENLRAVQFHPELQAPALALLMATRGIPGAPVPAGDGARLLANWVAHWVRDRRPDR